MTKPKSGKLDKIKKVPKNKSKFADMKITATPTELNELVKLFIEARLRPESIDLFNDNVTKMPIKSALYKSVINDVVIEALEHFFENYKNTL